MPWNPPHWARILLLGLLALGAVVLLGGVSTGSGQTGVIDPPIPVGDSPHGVGVNPSTNLIYVANGGSDNVSVIDGTTNAVVNTVGVGDGPQGLAVNPNDGHVYVANYGDNTVSVLPDGLTIPVGDSPFGIDVNPNTGRVYVANAGSDDVSVIEGGEVIATVPVGYMPRGVGVNPTTNLIYIGDYNNTVWVIDGDTNTVTDTLTDSFTWSMYSAWDVEVNPITNQIYVASCWSGWGMWVKVIDGYTNAIVDRITVGSCPWQLGVNPSANRVYVSNFDGDSVSIIDGAANDAVDTVYVGDGPAGVGINPGSGRVYVANYYDDNVSVIEDIVPTDSDGDGLLDVWEKPIADGGGLDVNGDGIIDLDLAALGASPWRKDIFVEVDYMDCARPGSWCAPWDLHTDLRIDAMSVVEHAFANAPFEPPPGAPPGTAGGIGLHIIEDEAIVHNDDTDSTQFYNLMKDHFGFESERGNLNWENIKAARRLVFHYALMIHRYTGDPKGALGGHFKGWSGFFVAMGEDRHSNGSVDDVAASFMHELGHSLGLGHGGGDIVNCKPNYFSIMNYMRAYKEFLPRWQLDYSRTAFPTLDESDLDEPLGLDAQDEIPPGAYVIYGPLHRVPRRFGVDGWEPSVAPAEGPIDWNADGDTNDQSLSQDLNNNLYMSVLGGLRKFGHPDCGIPDNDHDGQTDEDPINGDDDDGDGLLDEDGPGGLDVLSGHNDWDNLRYLPQRNATSPVSFSHSMTAAEFEDMLAAAPDLDGDDVPTGEDNCPLTANGDQSDNDGDGFPGSEPGLGDSFGGDACDPDDDNDGFTDEVETSVGTDPLLPCGPSAWPPDFDDDTRVNLADVFLFRSHFATIEGDPDYDPRFDLNADGRINLADVFILRQHFATQCAP